MNFNLNDFTMKRTTLCALMLALVGLASCNKDYATVKDLDGIWKMTTWVENGEEKDYMDQLEIRLRFEDCGSSDYGCEGLYYRRATYTQDSVEVSNQGFDYYVTDKGQSLKLEFEFGDVENYSIEKLTKSQLRLLSVDGVFDFTFQKQ